MNEGLKPDEELLSSLAAQMGFLSLVKDKEEIKPRDAAPAKDAPPPPKTYNQLT